MRDCEIINENLRCALAAFSWVDRTGDTRRIPGLSLAYSGVPYGLFNTAVLSEPLPTDFPGLLTSAERYFARKRSPWSVWICEDFFTPTERRRSSLSLSAMGLKNVMEAPGMITRTLSPPRDHLPKIEVRAVGDPETSSDFAAIMASSFVVPLDMSRRIYASPSLWKGPVKGFLAYRDGIPVSTAAIVIGGDAIGLYAVATRPEYQRQGFGEALMRMILSDTVADTGFETLVLQSSSPGYPLYLRMGFRHITRFSVFLADPDET